MADPYAGWTMRQGTDGTWYEVPPAERAPVANALMAARDRIPENPNTGWSASNMLRGALERSANLQDTVAGYRDPKTADPLDLVPMLAPGAIAGALRGPARSTLMSAGGVPPKDPPGFTAFHGSPHEFDRFSMDKIGSGEGAQAYGHGLYFADAEGTARSYRDQLSDKRGAHTIDGRALTQDGPELTAAHMIDEYGGIDGALAQARKELSIWDGGTLPKGSTLPEQIKYLEQWKARGTSPTPPSSAGHMYEVRIKADPADFLDWDKPLKEQSDKVRKAFADTLAPTVEKWEKIRPSLDSVEPRYRQHAIDSLDEQIAKARSGAMTTGEYLDVLAPSRDYREATSRLRDAGIPGIRYDDQMSRGASGGTRNTVVFDDKLIEILRKYGLLGAVAGGAASSGTSEAAPAPRNMLRP